MTALPADLLGEILYYVDDLYTVNALALTCRAGAQFVRESADFIADKLVTYQRGEYPALPNGVKHGDANIPLGFDYETFIATYRRGVVVSWMLSTDDGDIVRGHRDTHYVLSVPGNDGRPAHCICVTDRVQYHQAFVDEHHRGQRQRLEGYLIDDAIVPSVIEKWATVAMNVKQPTHPFVVYCGTEDHATALNALGIVNAVWIDA